MWSIFKRKKNRDIKSGTTPMLEFPDNSFRAAIIVIWGNGRHSYNERKQREYEQKKKIMK